MHLWVSVSLLYLLLRLESFHKEGRELMIDTFISKTTRLYKDSRALTQGSGSNAKPNQLDQLNENLQDVTRIMTKNMEDLLWRGDSLDRESPVSLLISPIYSPLLAPVLVSFIRLAGQCKDRADIGMSHLSTSLRSESAKYRKAARNINLQALIRKYAPIVGIGLFITLFLYWRFF
jgi:vesicle transport protein SEC22